MLGDSGDEDDDEQVWPVPLTVAADGAGVAATLVNAATGTVRVETPAEPDWFKVNPEQTGFYRVNYTDAGLGPAGSGHRKPDVASHGPIGDPKRRLRAGQSWTFAYHAIPDAGGSVPKRERCLRMERPGHQSA